MHSSSNKCKEFGKKLQVNHPVELNYNYSLNDKKVENMIPKVLEEIKTFVNKLQKSTRKLQIKLKLLLQ